MESHIQKIIHAVKKMQQGQYRVSVPAGEDDIALLGKEVQELGKTLELRFAEAQTLMKITEKINAGKVLNEILNYAFDALRPVIPYNRIGFSLLEQDGEIVRAVWAKSEAPNIRLANGYFAKTEGSSLLEILLTGRPRILNDLVQYLKDHPGSDSTRLIVDEGMCSSLTCPLLAMGKPIGFIFFSSTKPFAYEHAHVELFMQIANQISLIAEKSHLYQRLVELNDLKNKFLGIAAHDLRNPLTVIKGHLELLNDNLLGEISAVQRESVKNMIEYCDNMLNLINNLLDVSAIESGVIELKPRELDLRDFLEKNVQFHKITASAKAITFKTDFGDLPKMKIDPDRMAQVMNNLISNALKFSLPQTTVTVKAKNLGQCVEIAVIDQGQGIPDKDLPKIFEFFGKARTRPTHGEHSTGLGLAIVKRMIDAHQGTIRVESRVGVGTTFTITLPLIQTH